MSQILSTKISGYGAKSKKKFARLKKKKNKTTDWLPVVLTCFSLLLFYFLFSTNLFTFDGFIFKVDWWLKSVRIRFFCQLRFFSNKITFMLFSVNLVIFSINFYMECQAKINLFLEKYLKIINYKTHNIQNAVDGSFHFGLWPRIFFSSKCTKIQKKKIQKRYKWMLAPAIQFEIKKQPVASTPPAIL